MKPLIVSTGDPAGIGPEVAVKAAAQFDHPCVLVGGARQLMSLARAKGVQAQPWQPNASHPVAVLDAGDVEPHIVARRVPSEEGGRAQLRYLETAAALVREGKGRALVTGPTSKEAIERSGTAFTGQTEHLAALCGVPRDGVTMMFLGPKLRVALVTTHASVRDAAASIRAVHVRRTVLHLQEALRRMGRLGPIAVAGVNPHAGENGLFGREELEHVEPALQGLDVHGPMPAEAAFRYGASGRFEGVVAMLHDQATIASKLLDWGAAVNVTWGLPIVRTSVDHGTAYDIAGQDRAEPQGMVEALRLALALTPEKSPIDSHSP